MSYCDSVQHLVEDGAVQALSKTSVSLPSLAVQETPNLVDICWKVGGQGGGNNLVSQREKDCKKVEVGLDRAFYSLIPGILLKLYYR